MSGDLAGDIIAYCSMGRQPTTNPHTFRGDFQDAEVIGRRSLAKCLEVRVVFERISLGFIRSCLGQCLNAVVLHDFSDLYWRIFARIVLYFLFSFARGFSFLAVLW